MFEGVLTALVTPFRDGEIDETALRALVERQIDGGHRRPRAVRLDRRVRDALARRAPPRGRDRRARDARPRAGGRGRRARTTRARRSSSRCYAKEAGADGALLISPYYNKPTQEGIVPALRGDRAAHRVPARALQHPRAHRVEHAARDDRAARRPRAGGRHQGGVRRPRADLRGDRALPAGLHGALGRRRAHAARARDRRQGRDLDHVERRACGDGVARALVPRRRRRHARGAVTSGCCRSSTRCSSRPTRSRSRRRSSSIGAIGPEIRLPLTPLTAPNRERLQVVLKELGLIG